MNCFLRKLLPVILSVFILFVSAGCSVFKDSYVERFGNSVLEFAGLGTAKSVFDTAESINNISRTISREEEYFIGRAVAAKILNIYKLDDNPALTAYVNKVGLTVSSFSDMPDTFGGYHFAVLDTDEINAVSAPGGFVFISRGMLNTLKDEDELASVLAHEVGHISLQHGIKSISRENVQQFLASVGQLAGTLNCGQVFEQAKFIFNGVVDDIVGTLLDKGYSREQEFEADAVSLTIMSRTAYNPSAIASVFDDLERKSVNNSGGWFSTHPENSDRKRKALTVISDRDLASGSAAGRAARQKRFHAALAAAGFKG